MTVIYKWTENRRTVFGLAARAAPSIWPYPHRTMAEVMAGETCEQAVNIGLPVNHDSAMESAGRESALTLDPGPDHQHLVRGAKAMIPTTAPNVSAQPLSCGRRA